MQALIIKSKDDFFSPSGKPVMEHPILSWLLQEEDVMLLPPKTDLADLSSSNRTATPLPS